MSGALEYALEFDQEVGLAIVTIRGRLTVDGLLEALNAFWSDPRFEDGMRRMWDVSETDGTGIDSAAVGRLGDAARARLEAPGTRIAIVAPEPFAYGMVRMFEGAQAARSTDGFRAFHDREEAVAWLFAESSEAP